MTEPVEKVEQQLQANPESESAIDDIFSDSADTSKAEEPKNDAVPKQDQKQKKKRMEEDEPAVNKQADEGKKIGKKEVSKEADEETEVTKVRKDLEKANKALSDSQKWAHSNNRKMKSALRFIEELEKEGSLEEGLHARFNEILKSDGSDEEMVPPENQDPLGKLINIAKTKVADLRDVYDEDKLFDKKRNAFDFFMQNSPDIVVADMIEELAELEGSPLKLAKKMYSMGEEFYEKYYKKIDEAGGIIKYIESVEKNEEKLLKTIDRKNKSLSQYEDYDKPTHSIDELSEHSSNGELKSGIDEIFGS